MLPNGNRHGFTMIELLVVIAIVGLLVSLLLPSVVRVREAANRVTCADHLRQIGLAVHSYSSQYGVLPFLLGSYETDVSGKYATLFKAHSALTYLLPHLEMNELFNSVNFRTPLFIHTFPENATAMRTRIETFLCPSDPASNATLNRFGPVNYRLSYGSEPDFNFGGGLGTFLGFRCRRLVEISDGLSNTAMASEKARGSIADSYDPWSSMVLVSDNGTVLSADVLLRHCSNLPSPPGAYYSHTGNTWAIGDSLQTCYSHVGTPNSPIPDCGYDFIGGYPGMLSARSYHPGSVNVLFADGSVRSITDGIALTTWRALGTANGAEHETSF